MLFLFAHLGVAVVGCLLMHERSHHLPLVPVYRVVYEPLRAYLLYTSVHMAVRGAGRQARRTCRRHSHRASRAEADRGGAKTAPIRDLT